MEERPPSSWTNWSAAAYEVAADADGNSSRRFRLAVLGRHRSVPHLRRKAYHALMGVLCFVLYGFLLDRTQALIALASIGGAMCISDGVRLVSPKFNTFFLRVAGSVMRREELHGLTANTYYVLGLTLITAVFPKVVVLLSILYLALGDPAASIIGTRYGRTRLIGSKSLEGAVGCFIVCSILTFLFGVGYLALHSDAASALALLGGTAAVIAELVPLKLDDNFTLPVLASLQLYFILPILGIG